MSELSVMTRDALGRSISVFEKINDVLKGVGIVGGGIAASLADWVFGSVTFSVLFSNYYGANTARWIPLTVGLLISMGAWGVQLILWQIFMSGKYAKIGNGNWAQKLILGMVIMMKLADDFTDIMAVYWMLKDNPFQNVLTGGTYTMFIGVVFFLVWILVGFSELFVSMSISLLKPSNNYYKSNYTPKKYVPAEGPVKATVAPVMLNDDILRRMQENRNNAAKGKNRNHA